MCIVVAVGQESGLAVAGKGTTGILAASADASQNWKEYCRTCDSSTTVSAVLMPYVFRYLANELAGMGIRLTLEVDRL